MSHNGTDRLSAGLPGIDSRQGQYIFLYSTASRPAQRLTQPCVQLISRTSPAPPEGKVAGT
jgi:hypothetical protein